ncbi:MAG: hypothetical protein A2283_04530 [Lentisphaerae bacterium RIFOXYA12_FULL_48_11]|nr:MAG: hypothetical protein A2283_04530 [Lentisphaerae bacterium RIFOXYA12_FULL_48_11]
MHSNITETSNKQKSCSTPVCILEPDGRIQSYNIAFSDFLKRDTGSIIGRSCREVLNCTKEDVHQCPLAQIKTKPEKHPISIRRSIGSIKENAEPVFNDSGNISAVLLSFPTNTATSYIGSDLIKLQRLETVAQAAGGIVHDLNNILMCVNSEVCLLKKKLEELSVTYDTHETMTSLLSVISRGYGLTHQLLKLSKGQKPETRPTAIGAIITEAVHFSLIGSQIKSKVEISEDLMPVQINSDQVFQIVSNLVINARHATNPNNGSHVMVTADNLSKEETRRLDLKSGKYIRISIKDSGHGIPRPQIDHIFEPFFTTKPDGTGLGLSLVSLIVKELSGHITVESIVGKGSTFTVYLPALDLNVP